MLRAPLRSHSYLSDLTFESRGIEKMVDRIRDMVDEFLDNDIIDADYPEHLDDEELEIYRANREDLVMKMIAQSILGSDRIEVKEV